MDFLGDLYKFLITEPTQKVKNEWIEKRKQEAWQEIESLRGSPDGETKIKAIEAALKDISQPEQDWKKIDDEFVYTLTMGRIDKAKDWYYRGANINALVNGYFCNYNQILTEFRRGPVLISVCANGKFEAVAFLMSKGADPNIKDSEGQTARDVAQQEVAGLLEAFYKNEAADRKYIHQLSGMINFTSSHYGKQRN